MNKTLWVLSGLPASGKSTLAEQIVKDNRNTFRVNKDLLRKMLHFHDHLPRHEKLIADVNNLLVETLLKEGRNVVSDNTNLYERDINYYEKLAAENKANFKLVDMGISPETCVQWDAERRARGERYVGRDVILNMAHRHRLIKQEKEIAIFDMDGTLSDISKRRHYVRNTEDNQPDWKPNWNKFFNEVANDSLRENVYSRVLEHANLGHEIVICSGRPERTRKDTEAWLSKYNIPYARLIMRQDGDNQDDVTLKQGFLDKFLDKSKVVYIADDRPKVVRMWKSNKLNVEDFGDGIEF